MRSKRLKTFFSALFLAALALRGAKAQPSQLIFTNVGDASTPGSAVPVNGGGANGYTLTGSGSDIWNNRDGFPWQAIRRGWCLGAPEFKASLLDKMARKLGDHHSGELKWESVDAKAERIIAAELKRRHWTERDLEQRAKSAPEKLALVVRLRRETT